MLGYHCGARVRWIEDTKEHFRVRCVVCKKIFTQRKRQPLKKKEQ